MNKNFQNYFTTSEFAKLCGVNKRTLFHYHDIGLFYPTYIDNNGYRYYSYRQYDVFSIISMLKELDVPLKKIKVFIDERTPEQLLDLARQKINEVDKEIDKLNQIKHFMSEIILNTNKGINADCNNIAIEEQDEEYLIRSTLRKDDNNMDYMEWILEFTSFSESIKSKNTSLVGTILSNKSIINRMYYQYSYFFAKTCEKNKSNAVKPKGLYAIAKHRGSYETSYKTYEKILSFLEKNSLKVGCFAYEECLLNEVAMNNEIDYITQITIQVEPINFDCSK